MTNTNCLEGVTCPECGHSESFHIEATVVLYVTDHGSKDGGGDHYWDADSLCICGNDECYHEGRFEKFQVENQTRKGGQ